jgi:signal peptidase II
MSRKHLLLIVIGLAMLLADQGTKYLAVAHLTTALQERQGTVSRVAGFLVEQNLDNNPVEPGNPRAYRVKRDVRFIPDYWHFRYVENPGAAWGLLRGLPEPVRRPFFVGISLLALALIGFMYARLQPAQRLLRVALCLVVGGALGNLVDRVARGYVIDFIDWHWRNDPALRWPTFNVADVGISVGIFLMLLATLLEALASRRRAVPSEPEADPG